MATSLGLPISLTFFLLLLTKAISTDTTSFSFTKFHSNQPNLILQGDALVTSTGKLQLTSVDDNGIPTSNSLGRAIYTSPIHLWDNTTGNVASIVTSFAINISAPYKSTSAEGLAFFFAPVNSQAQNGAGYLGLFNSYKTDKTQQTVAVEIDTKPDDDWDPQNRHIGIDVNSIKSIKTASWGMANGQVATILITYDPYTKLLVASLVHASRRTSYILSETVDLKSVLPEYVSVGFSATTGVSEEYVETHDVLSWYFVSKLPDGSKDSLWNDADLVSYVMHGTM